MRLFWLILFKIISSTAHSTDYQKKKHQGKAVNLICKKSKILITGNNIMMYHAEQHGFYMKHQR